MMATAVQSRSWEEATCSKHGTKYLRHFVSGYDVWTGGCPECAEDEKLERRAREVLKEKMAEVHCEARKRIVTREKFIQRETDKQLKAYAASVRPHFENDVRSRMWDGIEAEVESEMLAGIISSLREAN